MIASFVRGLPVRDVEAALALAPGDQPARCWRPGASPPAASPRSSAYQITDSKTGEVVVSFGWDDRPNGTDRLAEAEAWLLGKDR